MASKKNTSVETTVAKPAKGAAKQAAKSEAVPAEKKSGLSPNQAKILAALAEKSGTELTRNQLKDATGIVKGFSKLLGAITLEGFGSAGEGGLISQGFVDFTSYEGDRASYYKITKAGAQALKEYNVAKAAKTAE